LIRILIGDCRLRLAELPGNSVDSVVCDPPYHLIAGGFNLRTMQRNGQGTLNKERAAGRGLKGFMGQTWDGGDVAFDPETWVEVLRVLKPGGHMLAFSGTRTYHRMAVAIEDAGFEVRDMIAWHYGSGFPKSLDVSKAIDKAAGAEREAVGTKRAGIATPSMRRREMVGGTHLEAEKVVHVTAPATDAAREWEGYGTALKPATEPICLARKPLSEKSVAANVLKWGTGAINVDGCRIEGATDDPNARARKNITGNKSDGTWNETNCGFSGTGAAWNASQGRWPANLIHDGSDEVVAGFPDVSGDSPNRKPRTNRASIGYGGSEVEFETGGHTDSGSAARFFYCAKATTEERGEGNNHPTVKPIALMQWLVRLVTPKGGTVLDPFSGSGSTLIAADMEQFNAIGCELSPEYAAIAEQRLRDAGGMFADVETCALASGAGYR
jgi:DNA modification methylase